MMRLIDTHSHLYAAEFDEDREEALQRAVDQGVAYLLTPAIDSDSHEAMFAFVRKHPQRCIPMMGLHPTSINDHPQWREELQQVARYLECPPQGIDRFCAVGEIGLDFYWDDRHKAEQIEAFEQQIEWSLAYDLPIAVHTREAWAETLEVMRRFAGRGVRGVFHAYSEGIDCYRELKTLGNFKFGIGGVVTFKRATLAGVVAQMEIEDLVLETDCPYLTPAPHRGKRNESAYVRFVCEKVAQIKNLSPEAVAEQTSLTAEALFSLGK